MENSPSLMPLTFLMSSIVLNGRAVDDGLGLHRADARQRVELFLGGGVDIDLLAGLSLGHGLGRRVDLAAVRAEAVLAAAGAGSSPNVTRSRRAAIRVLPRPLILSSSSTDFQGRPSTMAFAVAGPIPGRSSSAASSAVLRFTLPFAVSLARSTLDSAALEPAVFDLAASALASIAAPSVTCGRMPSITRLETPALARSSTLE